MPRKQRPTRRFLSLEPLEQRLCLSSVPQDTALAQTDAATQAHLTATYDELPLSFEANEGQTASRVNFLARGAGYSAFLMPTSAVMELQHGDGGNVVAMKLVGASPTSHGVGLDKLPGVSNYLVGDNPSKWPTNIASYAKVKYQDVYRGINLIYHGDQQQLEYDLVVKPGADPRAIRLAFAGSHGKSIDAQGNLVLHTAGGDLVEQAPVAYQTIHGARHLVASRFAIGRGGQVGFRVGRYDHTRSLVIDPVLSLSYSTYLGGNDEGIAVAVDSAGNAYLTGIASSGKFLPTTTGAFQTKFKGNYDAFVLKLNPNLSGAASLIYSTFLGGSGYEEGQGIAVDGAGDAYVTGYTNSTNFPTKNGYQAYQGGLDVFVTKLNPSGSQLLYSTYLGGSGDESGVGIALDNAGAAYVTGYTGSADTGAGAFPTTAGAYITSGNGAFVAKFNPNVSGTASLIYSTLLGGNDGWDQSQPGSIAVDGSGDAIVAGTTFSSSFPTTAGAFQPVGDGGAFVTKLNSTGTGVVFSTYLSSSTEVTEGGGVALDSAGNIYVTGRTNSLDFPVTASAFQPSLDLHGLVSWEGFVSKLSADGSQLLYSTYFGGSNGDNVEVGYNNATLSGIAVDASGMIYVTGNAPFYDFPTKLPFQKYPVSGQTETFVAKFDPGQTGDNSLIYSTFLGPSTTGSGKGIAAYTDPAGNTYAYVTGITYAKDFPTTGNAFQPKSGKGGAYAFFTILAFN